MVLFAGPTLAQSADPIPELTDAQRQSIASGLQHGASYGDPAFDTLVDDVRSWGRLMVRWAADHTLAPHPASPDRIMALNEDPDAPGTPVVIFGQFLEREPLAKYANMERWIVAPLDANDPSYTPDRAAIVFVDRTTSASLALVEKGRYVHLAARYYKPLVLPRRTTGEEVAYPSFVGASFGATIRRSETSISGLFAFVGIGVALMVAAFVVLIVVVSKIRSKPSTFGVPPSPAGQSPHRDESGLPSDPAEALEHLSRRGDSADKHSDA